MDKTEIKEALVRNYGRFTAYLASLPAEQYHFARPGKWSAAQQLKHLLISLKTTVKGYGMSPELLAEKFGIKGSSGQSYLQLKEEYCKKLQQGGKAPQQFGPEMVPENDQKILLSTLTSLVDTLSDRLDRFSEGELNRLCLPHPLLGQLSLREMLYNVIFHVEHHQHLIQHSLTEYAATKNQ